MDDVGVGRAIRAVRRRRGWRQADLAAASGCSQALVSRIEAGAVGGTTVELLRTICRSLGMRLELRPSWRGADLDRLVDADHATIVGAISDRLERDDWEVLLEVTYSEFGERGSIDILGLHRRRPAVVVIEVKSDLTSSEAVGRKLDEKARLAPKIVADRLRRYPTEVGRILVVPDTGRLRMLVKRTPSLRRLFPDGGIRVAAWLRAPTGALSGVMFLPDISLRNGRRRIRARGGGSMAQLRSDRGGTSRRSAADMVPGSPKMREGDG